MTEAEFADLRAFLRRASGLALGSDKRYLAESRLPPVCRDFGLSGLSALIEALRAGGDPRLGPAVVEAMATHETSFFRDRAPFALFDDVLLPRILAADAGRRHLRIWCAAASTGQEPYSLAILLREAAARLAGWRVEIVATDLGAGVIERARLGRYSHYEVQRGLPVQWLVKYFTRAGSEWEVVPAVRAMVDFRTLNLLDPFAGLGRFDLILCRNVLMYFDAPTRADVLARLADRLAPEGALLLGATETAVGMTDVVAPHPVHRGLFGRAAREAPMIAPTARLKASDAARPAVF